MEFERQSKHDRQEGERAAQFSVGGMKIGSAVGRQPSLNSVKDQITVTELLSRISPANGGPTWPLHDPKVPGQADSGLVNAILAFQRKMASKGLIPPAYCDGRVDAGGTSSLFLTVSPVPVKAMQNQFHRKRRRKDWRF